MFKYYSHNNLKIGLLITATQFLMASGCNKDSTRPCPFGTSYSFNVTSEFAPQKEVYNVGDTIFLTSTFSKTLTSLISNQQVDYSNSTGIGGTFTFSNLDTINKTVQDALNKFQVFDVIGTTAIITNIPNSGKVITFNETNLYQFKVGVILKNKGIFQLAVSDLSSNGLRGKDCTNAGFNMTVTNTNKNLNLFQYALGYTPDALLQKSIYCFRVQ
jgi:hypothetical protein